MGDTIKYKIKEVNARQIPDSRGNPTIEVEIFTQDCSAKASVPSGASKGKYESLELRDKDGSVKTAINNINTKIKKTILGLDIENIEELDNTLINLDGTENKSKLGANAILGVSLAAARLKSIIDKKPLYTNLGSGKIIPVPYMNIINGGKHAQNGLPFQEYMIVPKLKNFNDSLNASLEIYKNLKQIIQKKYGKESLVLGDEGGFAPNISDIEEPLLLLTKAIEKSGYNKEIKLAIDIAASEFYKPGLFGQEGHYIINDKKFAHHKMIEVYENLINNYPIISIEDPFYEENFEHFAEFTKQFKKKVQIVGDDLLVTNVQRIQKAIELGSCNALLLKVNQIGTLTEAMNAAKLAMENKWHVMVSHRSGETMDTFISDLAVGLGTGQIKAGAPSKPERMIKYQRLIEIEKELGKTGSFGK